MDADSKNWAGWDRPDHPRSGGRTLAPSGNSKASVLILLIFIGYLTYPHVAAVWLTAIDTGTPAVAGWRGSLRRDEQQDHDRGHWDTYLILHMRRHGGLCAEPVKSGDHFARPPHARPPLP